MPPEKRRSPLATAVVRTEQLSPSMVRIVLGGGDLDRFTPLELTDSYVKVLMLHPEVDYPKPLDVEAIRATLPQPAWPRPRTYTIRWWDADAKELALDFVVHGDDGLAGPWARDAKVGDEVFLLGPGGEYAPDLSADWHLLVGDESALPAIAAALDALPADATVHAFVEVHDPSEQIPLSHPVTWVHREDTERGELLVRAVTALDRPDGRVHAFVHGEAGVMKRLRAVLVQQWQVPRAQLSISGYWRLGADDEGWRAIKRDWNREIEESEAQTY